MYTSLTNLLSRQNVKAFHRDYYFRFATVCVIAAVVIVLINALLLLPAFLYVRGQAAELDAQLAALNQQNKSTEEEQVNARTEAIRTYATYLERLATQPQVSTEIRSLLLVPRTGITLRSFTMTPAKDAAPRTIVLSGVAATRESLRSYTLALGQVPFVANADLPISAYAKESAIPFTITLTIKSI